MPSAPMVVSILALVVAVTGTAVAASALNREEKKQVKKISSGQVKKLAPGLSVASAENATRSQTADRAIAADTAATAAATDTATSANQLAGLSPASVNATSFAFADDTCDPGDNVICASTQLNQPRTSDVLVLAIATMFGTGADVSGSCDLEGPGSNEFAGFAEIGQVNEPHPNVDRGDGFVVPGLFQDVPAGPSTFSLTCSQDTGDLKIGGQQIVAMRLSG
jgi:hypothetical protein